MVHVWKMRGLSRGWNKIDVVAVDARVTATTAEILGRKARSRSV